MTATVRSVRVVMEADVAGYVRDMRLAGRETDEAFGRLDTRLKATNRTVSAADTSTTRLAASQSSLTRTSARMNTELGRTDQIVRRNASALDSYSGRASLAAEALATIGPAAIPIGALAIPALVGLAAQGGVTAAALGSTVFAFQGVGDALKALGDYEADRSVENLEQVRQTMQNLGPEARVLSRQLFGLRDEARALRDTAAAGILPGVSEALDDLETKLPRAQAVLAAISSETGSIIAGAGDSIASGRFDDFLTYLATDGRTILNDTAATVGSLGHAIAEVFVATSPLQQDFTGWLRDLASDLDDAASGLGDSAGLRDFIEYVRTTGPQVSDTLGAVANAVVQIVQAAAPLGGPALQFLETAADALGNIADSDLGTPLLAGIGALLLYNRTLAITAKLNATSFGGAAIGNVKAYTAQLTTVTTAQQRAQMSAKEMAAAEATAAATRRDGLATLARSAALAGGLALAASGVADSTGLANTAMLATLGPWGAAAGVALDTKAAYDRVRDSVDGLDEALSSTSIDLITDRIATASTELDRINANTVLGTSFLGDKLGAVANFTAPLANFDKTVATLTGGGDELESKLAAAEERLAGFQNGTLQAFDPVASLTGAILAAGAAADAEAEALRGSIDAMREKRSEALRGLNAELDYQQAIDDAAQSLKVNGRTVDESTEKGRDNLRNLYALAGAWNQQSNAQKNASGGLKAARANFLDVADAMGVSEGRAKRLADRLFEIKPRDVTVTVNGIDNAVNRAQGLKAVLDALKSKDIYVALHYQTIGNKPKAPTPGGSADGGTVPRTGLPYADRHPYLLADGEEVVSNRRGQADRHRGLLKAINAGRLADGGTVNPVDTYTRRRPAGDTAESADRANRRRATAILPLEQAAIAAADGLKGLRAESKRLERQTGKLERATERQQKAVDTATTAQERAQGRYDGIASTTSGLLTSDVFEVDTSNPWAAGGRGGMDAIGKLETDIANSKAFDDLLAQLSGRGLGKAALEDAASKGLPALQVLAGYSDTDLARIGTLYDQRGTAVGSSGKAAADLFAGQELAAANSSLAEALRAYDRIENRLKDNQQATHQVENAIKQADASNRAGQDKNARDTGAEIKSSAGKGKRDRVYAGGSGGRRH